VPADERLGQANFRDQLRDRSGPGGEPADDPQTVDVGKGLVDEAQLAEFVGLEDGVRDRAANAGGGGGQGALRWIGVASTTVYSNRR
jgi:hypothetical protein